VDKPKNDTKLFEQETALACIKHWKKQKRKGEAMIDYNNSQLTKARRAKNDEFYTQLTDIEKELRHYRRHFEGKVVLCNCDDPFESNFFKYFVLNFNRLGLKKLIATCYTGSPIANQQLSIFDVIGKEDDNSNKPYKAIVTKVYDKTGDGGVDMFDVAELFKSGENQLSELQGNGDFRSAECLSLLAEADIVVTNPPFSLFREYVATLIEYGKKFVIMGNKNAITYKEFFPYLMNNKIWAGATSLNGGRWMIMPRAVEVESKKAKTNEHGEIILNVAGVCWFTNLDIKKRHDSLIMIKRYSPDEYEKFENMDGAINVDKVVDIPMDYPGVMGVPVTFFEKYNPDQFEIVGCADADIVPDEWKGMSQKFVDLYYLQGNTGSYKQGNRLACYISHAGEAKVPFKRVLIRNKHPEEANK